MSFDRVQFRTPESETSEQDGVTPSSDARVHTMNMAPGESFAKNRQGMSEDNGMISSKIAGIALAVVVILGVGTGFLGSRFSGQSASFMSPKIEDAKTAEEVASAIKVGAVFGSADSKTFKDEVEGVLIKGGLSGEGSHTLLREGGKSQNVYLTSSVVDLDQFENMKVHVWGETFKGQKAGWLMDVGRLEVKELTPEKPSWYSQQK